MWRFWLLFKGMPTLKYQGKPFLGFDAHRQHIGIYPYSGEVIERLKDQLQGYGFSGGAIRVPLDRPIFRTARADHYLVAFLDL